MIELRISTHGLIRALYSELIPIQVLGSVQITRASHVEPDASGNWWADLKPSNGPLLGPFTYRSQALQAERDWLTQNVLFGPVSSSVAIKKATDEASPSPEVTSASIIRATNAFQTPAGGTNLP